MPADTRSGFTLIELSIVLVVIGLVTAGILVGRDLIDQAELRSVITDVEKYQTAVNTFKAKYNCLPGDCKNATDFFGTQTGGGGCPHPSVPSTADNPATCNGNGNGTIWGYLDYVPLDYEKLRFWQHLSAAGLVGYFPGIGYLEGGFLPSDEAIFYGYNAPKSVFPRTGYTVAHGSTLDAYALRYFKPLSNSHLIILGTIDGCDATGCAMNFDLMTGAYAGITPDRAFLLDTKADDGKPGGGHINAPPIDGGYGTSWTFCTTGDHTQAATAAYNLAVKTQVCPLFFISSF